MWRSLFLLVTSVVAAACSDNPSCGPGSAAEVFTVSNGSDVMLTYGSLLSSANNDCRDPSAPSGVVSLTINATQTTGTSIVTFCIPRPDTLAKTPGQLGTDVKVVDFNGTANSCTLTLDSLAPPSGTVTADGMCKDGTDKAGYALAFNAHLVLNRACATSNDMVPVTLSGTVAVSAAP
jgi:hypothetical protein